VADLSEWIRKRRRDQFYRKAKANGYRSRASYKLLQLHRRYFIFRRGDRVLDIGSAPGGWSQATRQLVGRQGLVVGVDLQETPKLGFDNVIFIKGDIMEDGTEQLIASVSREFDVILSDASPTISGIWTRDHLLSVDLARKALSLCRSLLKEGGSLVVKVFQGEELDALQREAKALFDSVKRAKPEASRGESSEVYIVGKGYHGPGSENADGL